MWGSGSLEERLWRKVRWTLLTADRISAAVERVFVRSRKCILSEDVCSAELQLGQWCVH